MQKSIWYALVLKESGRISGIFPDYATTMLKKTSYENVIKFYLKVDKKTNRIYAENIRRHTA